MRRLISTGTLIHAKVVEINKTKQQNIVFNRADPLRVWVGFSLPGAPIVYAEGMLEQLPDSSQRIRVGDPIDVRVDPTDLVEGEKPSERIARKWTDRTEPRPWHVEFTVVLLLVPLLLAVALIALWRRRQIVHVWRSGEAALRSVIGHRHTAVAPFSRVIRFTLEGSDDRRVWTTLHPSHDLPAVGELIWIVHAPGNPGRAVVAHLYN